METNPPRRRVMDPAGPPIAEDATAPSMGGGDADVMSGPVREGPGGRMTEPAPSVAEEEGAEYGEMQPRSEPAVTQGAEAFAARGSGEGYLRLAIDVQDGTLRVVDAAVVDGPLVHTDLTGQMAYEAVVRGRRVAADAFDDLAQEHAFAPPDQPELGHHTAELSSYQFVARIPRSEVTAEELPDLEITLMRLAQTTQLSDRLRPQSTEPVADAALAFGIEPPEVVGRLSGVDLDTALPHERAEAVRRGLR